MRLTCLRYVIRKNAALKPVVPISQVQYKEPVLLARTAFALPQPPSSGSELPRSLPLRTSITDTVRARIESLPEYPAVEGTAWTGIGVSDLIVNRLREHYPHIKAPTPAQRAFLLSVFRGQDVFLRDDMGRGKTLAIVIAALTLIYRTLNRATRRRKQPLPEGTRIIILVPTSHLAQQVQEHLEKLDPCLGPPTDPASTIPPQALFARLQPRLDPTQCPEIPTSLILLATAKHLASYEAFPTPDLELVCTDEPDTMLGPVPTRHMPTHSAHLHPINRHPPALVSLINDLLGISPADSPTEGKRKPELLDLDFSQRRPIQTVWTSATIHSQIRRFAKTRGWIRAGGQVVDLDFTVLASEKQRIAREEAGKMPVGLERLELAHGALNPVVAVEPEHFALVVDPMTGDISQLSSDSTSVETSNFAVSEKKGAVPPVLLESLAILHATSPPPPGTYALVLPPEGTSIDALSNELDSLGVPNLLLTPEALALGLPEAPGLLIARRSTVTGLHLANLHTIYLLSGLDVSGLSPGQKRVRQGVSGRVKFYDIVSGRVGRLGTSAADGERDGLAQKQRVVSLVLGGGEEEEGLRDMFFGRRSVEYGRPEERDEDGEVVRRRTLSGWDWEGLGRRLEEGMGDEGKEGEEMEEAELVRPGEGMA